MIWRGLIPLLLSVALVDAAPVLGAERSDTPTAAQKSHIDALLAPAGGLWAKARRANPVVDGAIVCRDLATVDAVTYQITEAAGDRMVSIATQGKIDRVRAPTPMPNLAAYGCTFLPTGTRMLVLDRAPVPFVQADINGTTIKGVASPVTVQYDSPAGPAK